MGVAAPGRPETLSRSTEYYLKAIYRLGTSVEPVQTTSIADALEVAPASVSGMLKRLAEAGLLEHVPYRGVKLTEPGRNAALSVVRRHRILESYLTSMLGYDWDSVHEEAERLEHAASDDLIDRMARVLGDPSHDPHGAPIPTRFGEIEQPAHVPLSEVAAGTTAVLKTVSDKDPARLRFIRALGLNVGTVFEVVDHQPFRGPVTIRVANGARRVVGYELATSLGCAVAGDLA